MPSSVEVNLKTTRWPKTKIHFPNTGTLGRHGEPLASSSLDATSVCRSTRNGSGKRPSSRCADRPKSSQASTSVIRHSDAVVAQRGRNVSFEAKMLWLDLGSTHTEQRAGKELPADKATEESNRAVERDTAPTSSTRESTAICSCLKAERTSRHRPPTRKNCWGGSSYTELITTAIESSPQRRLSLAQIYEWIVKNVPYFKDKERYLSVQGWKVGVCCVNPKSVRSKQ